MDSGDYDGDDEYEKYEEATETGLPPGTCGYCGGAHHIDEHATDGELAREARDAGRDHTPEPPDDWYGEDTGERG